MSVQGFNFGNGVEKYDFESLDNIPELALPDGNYPDMTVGNADQLNSSMYVEDSVPYLYRTSGGSKDIGDREYLEIVGGSVGWNQIIDPTPVSSTIISEVTITKNSDNSLTFNGTANANTSLTLQINSPFKADGHKYLFSGYKNSGSNVGGFGFNGFIIDNGNGGIKEYQDSYTALNLRVDIRSGDTFDNVTMRFQCFDLTRMFGSTIADYIYTLETATAGAGVAKLKSWGFFTKDYYPYDAGSLKSVDGLENHVTVGFNQWDEEWEVGAYLLETGLPYSATDKIRNKNFIPVIPSANYYAQVPYASSTAFDVFYYDADKNFIEYNRFNRLFTTPSNCHFINFNTAPAYGTTYNHDICINLSWSGYRNGEYEPYVSHSYPLDSSLTLRGIPKKDDDGNLYFDGDVYSSDGTVTRRYGVVDLGTLTWGKATVTDITYFRSNLQSVKHETLNIICDKYEKVASIYDRNDKTISTAGYAWLTGEINVFDSTYNDSDATAFKTAMSGVYLVYELATPTTETADPFQSPQIVDDFGTEQFVTDSIVPVGHATKYPANLRDKLQHLPSPTGTDGYYAIHEDGNQMTLSPLPAEIPAVPTTSDGTYVLKATVSSGTVTLTWDAE